MKLAILVVIVIVATFAVHRALHSGDAPATVDPTTADHPERLTIYTTFYPTTYFTSQIVQGIADVVCPVPADADPIFWQPDDASIAAYQAADLIIINGAGFEKWVTTTTLPTSRLVDTAAPLAGSFLKYKDAITHSHGEGAEHSHEGTDGHTWVDPQNAITQSTEIFEALKKTIPEYAADFETNHATLTKNLNSLHQSLTAIPAGTAFLANHPAYNYLAQRHGWKIENVNLDPATPPTEADLLEIQLVLETHPTKIILWESEPLPETTALLKEQFDLTSLTFSPCESPPETGDYLTTMQTNVTALKTTLAP